MEVTSTSVLLVVAKDGSPRRVVAKERVARSRMPRMVMLENLTIAGTTTVVVARIVVVERSMVAKEVTPTKQAMHQHQPQHPQLTLWFPTNLDAEEAVREEARDRTDSRRIAMRNHMSHMSRKHIFLWFAAST
jgi:hypothetical protein